MAKTQNLKPDTILKNYWSGNEQFADLFNAVLFGGRQIFKPDELEDVDTESSSVLEHGDYAESIQAARDNIKICKKSSVYGVELVMLGAESQIHIHYGMPMRVMGYDYITYKKQFDSNARQYQKRNGLDDDEFLSRMKRTDRFMPVITIVVYYGAKPWDGALSLHGILDIPEELKMFVNDYKLMLVEARQNDLTFHNADNIHFFDLLKVILDNNIPKNDAKEKAIQYARKHDIDPKILMTIAGAANCKINYNTSFERGETGMNTLFDKIAIDSKTEGKAEGIIETGFDIGLSEDDILNRLQNKLKISLQEAQEYLEMFGRQLV